MLQAIVEEYITFSSGALRLRGVLAYPEETAPERAVLLCSPHPHFAGDMNNNVICAVARRLAAHCVVLRFDYRGVGESEITLGPDESVFDYWNAVEETKDYRDAVEDVTAAARALLAAAEPLDLGLSIIGYSFGAATGALVGCNEKRVEKMIAIAPPLGKVSFAFLADCRKHCLHIIGKKDFLYSDEKMAAFSQSVGPAVEITVLDNADHFFRGDEDAIARQIEDYLFGTKGI